MPGYHLPTIGQQVRLRHVEGSFDDVVSVVAADKELVTVATQRDAPQVHLIFTSRMGPVRLTGPLMSTPGGGHVQIIEEEVHQRRGAFRVGLVANAVVTRGSEDLLSCVVLDLSLTGALLGGDDAMLLALDEHVVLHIQSADLAGLALTGTVIRRQGGNRAMRFDPLAHRDDAMLHKFVVAQQRNRM